MPDELSAADHSSPDSQPEHKAASVFRDRSFHGLAISQFLGAFNDNLFKQLVLLLCVGRATTEADGGDLQPVAMAVFAVPWLLLSGLAGVLADRTSKRAGIVLFKSLEIAVMTAGLLAFLSGELWPLMIVLFLMSAQSAFFGPPKYGILPELFRARDLPTVNGIFQMTTFLAIIFGMATAGYARDWFPGQSGLAWTSSGSILVAILGTAAALMIRRTPPAQADLQFSWRAAGIDPDNWNLLKTDRFIRGVLLVSALFWFSGAVVQQAVNSFGKRELGLSDTRTSLLAASLGIGIAAGCVIGGQLSKSRIRFGLVRSGSWGLVASLLALVAVSLVRAAGVKWLAGAPPAGDAILNASPVEWLSRIALIGVGAFGGIFIVPLQVCLQASPPDSQKGRMIATMNFANWVGILLAAAFYFVVDSLRRGISTELEVSLPPATMFGALAVVLLPVALLYRPPDRDLG
jgi:MFS family permease